MVRKENSISNKLSPGIVLFGVIFVFLIIVGLSNSNKGVTGGSIFDFSRPSCEYFDSGWMKGDLNNDKKVSDVDITIINRQIEKKFKYIYFYDLDVDEDIDDEDRKYIEKLMNCR